MKSIFDMPNIELSAAQLLRAVNSLIEYRDQVTRPTLARWRDDWEQPTGPYSWDDAKVYATYGDFLALGFSAENSKKYTIEKLTKEQQYEQPSTAECASQATIETTAEAIG